MGDWARENGGPLRIARNRTGSIFRPNSKYKMRSRTKIIKKSPPGRAGILPCAENVAVSKSREMAQVAYLGQITNIGSGCKEKL